MIRIASFAGEIPQLIPRLLNPSYAQHAKDTKLENGALLPMRRASIVQIMDADCKTIYKHGAEWLAWPSHVNIEPGPVANDRLYIMGPEIKPTLKVGDRLFELALKRPNTRLNAVATGDLDEDLLSTVIFAYTWVTEFNEESEPSDLSEGISWNSGMTVELTGFDTPPQDRAIDRMRIYRSQTSALGDTTLYFIAEVAADTATFTYDEDTYPMNEVLASTEYNPPPDDLQGLIGLPNGMMAAFKGKEVYFSEPWRPHAWPEKYVLTVDYNVVGLGAFGSSVAVLTDGMPYIMQGTTPDAMVSERLEVNLPCLSAHSIVDLGYSVAYASTQGLVTISQNGTVVATASMLTADQWRAMNPETFIAGQYNNRYVVSYDYIDEFGQTQKDIALFDLSGAQPFLMRASGYADAMHFELGTGRLFLLRNGREIHEWEPQGNPYLVQQWKSKEFLFSSYTNFGCVLVEGESYAMNNQQGNLEDPFFEMDIFADRRRVATIKHMNRVIPLPSGFTAKTWEVEVRSNQMITGIIIAYNATQISES